MAFVIGPNSYRTRAGRAKSGERMSYCTSAVVRGSRLPSLLSLPSKGPSRADNALESWTRLAKRRAGSEALSFPWEILSQLVGVRRFFCSRWGANLGLVIDNRVLREEVLPQEYSVVLSQANRKAGVLGSLRAALIENAGLRYLG